VKGRLARLRAEVRSDRRAFEARVDELRGIDVATAREPELAQAAVALHHAYGAVEAALSRVARELEGSLPTGPNWHRELLEAMALDLEGVRPALLSQTSLAGLRRLLAFRHFFRHAYAVAWDRARLGELRDVAVGLRASLGPDWDAIDQMLGTLVGAAET
jgi:hypothetical protein